MQTPDLGNHVLEKRTRAAPLLLHRQEAACTKQSTSQFTTPHFKAGRTRRRGGGRRGRLARQAVVEAHLVGQAAQVAVAWLAVVAALREADRQVAEVAIDCACTQGMPKSGRHELVTHREQFKSAAFAVQGTLVARLALGSPRVLSKQACANMLRITTAR